MKTVWTKGLDDDAKSEMEHLYAASNLVRKRLLTLLQEKDGVADKASLSSDNYESPSWGFIQADNVGYRRALREVMSLIS